MQPSEAMASRRGQIYRAHRVERGTRPHEPPPTPWAGPYLMLIGVPLWSPSIGVDIKQYDIQAHSALLHCAN